MSNILKIYKGLGKNINVLAVANILSIPSALIGGYLSVKYDKKLIAIIPQLFTAILYIGVVVVNYVGIKIGFAILGFCISNMSLPAIDACIADYSKKKIKLYRFPYNHRAGSVRVGSLQ
ncbi:MAG: hypothetical protein WCD89_12225 [Anaerocolumna sp.]